MTTRRTGAPVWVDLLTPDLDRAKAFYGELFGWDIRDRGVDGDSYHIAYHPALVGDDERQGEIAGLIEQGPEIAVETPAAWSTYLHVDDIAETLERVAEHGGHVYYGPVQVDGAYGPEGTLAFLTDPAGAVVGVWEPGARQDLRFATGHGQISWVECVSTRLDLTLDFYRSVFDMPLAESHEQDHRYYVLGDLDEPELGFGEAEVLAPRQPSHWRLYFTVDDADESATQVTALGGTVIESAADTLHGRMVPCLDDQGAFFVLCGPV